MCKKLSVEEFVKRAGYSSIDEIKVAMQEMREMDIRDVDPEDLSEIGDIQIDNSATLEERVAALLQQTKNPYCFKYNGMIVKISFAGKTSLEECLVNCFICD